MNRILSTLTLWLCTLAVFAQGIQPIKRTNSGIVELKAVVRDITQYPLTTAGNAALLNAVNNGSLAIIARPAATATTVQTFVSARYTYNSSTNSISIEGAASTAVQLKIERVDGTALVLGNPDNPSLSGGVFYGAGPLANQGTYTQQWAFAPRSGVSGSGVPAVALKLTFMNSDNTLFTYSFTPVTTTRTQLFTASTASTTPGTSTTTTTGGSSSANYTPLAASVIPSDYQATSATSQVEVRLNLKNGTATDPTGNGLAGGVSWIGIPGSFNMLNAYVVGQNPKLWDNGRSLMVALYLGTNANNTAYVANGGTSRKTPTDPGIGNDPVEQGDTYHNSSTLKNYGKGQDGTLYTNIDPIQWDMHNVHTGALMKKWITPVGRALKIRMENSTNEPVPNVKTARAQELPCLYGAGRLHTMKFYVGSSPYTGGALTTARFPDNYNSLLGGGYYLAEPWIALVGDDASQAIGLFMYANHRTAIGKFGESWSNADGSDGNANYLGNCPFVIIDDVMTIRDSVEVIVGSVEEIRAYVYNHTFKPAHTPVFRFNKSTRQGWYWNDATDTFAPNSDGWNVTFNNYQSRIWSPAGSWRGSEMGTLYVNMTLSGGPSKMYFSWHQPGQKEGDPADPNNTNIPLLQVLYPNGNQADGSQTVGFDVINDGQPHTYAISLGGNSRWTGKVISEFSIGATFNGNSAVAGQQVKMNWINTVNSAPN